MTERIIEMLPLRYSDTALAASLPARRHGTPRALPAEIAVEREERTRMSAGDADCWVVLLRAGAMEERLWVDKARGLVVRTEQMTSAGRVVGDLTRKSKYPVLEYRYRVPAGHSGNPVGLA